MKLIETPSLPQDAPHGWGQRLTQQVYDLLRAANREVNRINAPPQDAPYAATITPNAAGAKTIIVGTLTGALAMAAPVNMEKGFSLVFCFAQDGTGGRVITWNAAFKKAADVVGAANLKASTEFTYDGTHWIQRGGALTWY